MKKLFFLILVFQSVMLSQVPYNLQPDWISNDLPGYGTGGAWVDINNDGWLDLVVANGNDMSRQNVAVYFNNAGTISSTPGWLSSDIDYHGHLDVGDINKDGFMDVAVSVYIGPAGFSEKGKLKMYLNNNGILNSTPSWISADAFYSFSCALGDADGDGDLDLAAAAGESYYNKSEMKRIYYNNNGVLSTTPGWMSQSAGYSYDVEWADIDNDGDLDLVFADEKGPNKLFINYGDSIATVPSWQSADASLYANSLFIKDINNDGFADLAVSDNNQLGGSGKFKIYVNNSGVLSTTPFWTSAFSGYGSGITLADIDNDNDNDLITGGWWQPCRIYLNSNGNFPASPEWTSTSGSVVEAIFLADFDKDWIIRDSVTFISSGSGKLYYIPKAPVNKILQVSADNNPVAYGDYSFDLENGWINLKNLPVSGTVLKIIYEYSKDLDVAVTNWDSDKGNYIFKSKSFVPVELTSFNAQIVNGKVTLFWTTATETNNLGFEIQRKSKTTDWITAAFRKGAGNTTTIQQYSYEEGELNPGRYLYRLKQVDYDGSYEYSDEVEVDFSGINTFLLEQNYPNPFNPSTIIGFYIPERTSIRLTVINAIGEETAELINGVKEAGYHKAEFNASDLPGGVYFYRLTAGSFIQTRKMILIK